MAFLQRVQVPYTPFFYFLFPSRSNLDEFNKLLSYLTYQGFRYLQYAIRDKFESLSINLKNCILERDVRLESIHDLIHVLEDIVAEGEAE